MNTDTTDNLELRMYFLVPYNISPIQQAIQAGHAALEYANEYNHKDIFREFMCYKTWIILNGGTTNDKFGTMQAHLEFLEDKIVCSTFNEPDLNNALTAICFIVDERLFNTKKYPSPLEHIDKITDDDAYASSVSMLLFDDDLENKITEYIGSIGGKGNLYLRNYMRQFRLA